MGAPFPPFKVRRLGVHLPGTKGLNIAQQDIDYIEYFSSLCYCNVIEVQDAHFERVAVVIDDMEAKGLFKKLISKTVTFARSIMPTSKIAKKSASTKNFVAT